MNTAQESDMTPEQELVYDALINHFTALNEVFSESGTDISSETLSFYINIIFDMSKTKYELQPKEDPYDADFLLEFSKYYLYFVAHRKGSQNEHFICHSLARVLIKDCLKPGQVDNDMSRILAELNSGKTETNVPLDEDDIFNLEEAYQALDALKTHVISALEDDATDRSDKPLIQGNTYVSELRGDFLSSMSNGQIEKLINDFFGFMLENEDFDDMNSVQEFRYTEMKQFYFDAIHLIAQTGFRFNFLEDIYHRCFLVTFSDVYAQVTTPEDLKEADIGEQFFWQSLRSILISSVEELQGEFVNDQLNILNAKVQEFNQPNDYSEEEKNAVSCYYETLRNFQRYVILWDAPFFKQEICTSFNIIDSMNPEQKFEVVQAALDEEYQQQRENLGIAEHLWNPPKPRLH